MSKAVKWIVGLTALAGAIALLAWAFVAGRKELAAEREREKPVTAPQRVSRGSAGETIVSLDAATQTRIALKVEPLAAATLPREVAGYGLVLTPEPLAALDAELSAAEAALAASKAAADRLRTLRQESDNVSAKSLETAEAQFRADESRARNAAQRLALGWGDAVSSLDAPAREKLVAGLVKREVALARVDLPAGEMLAASPVSAHVVVLGREDRPLEASGVWIAPAIDPTTLGQGFLLRIESAIQPGAAVTAYLATPGEPRTGVVIPRAALIRAAGKTWAYVKVGEGHFTRIEVAPEHPVAQGWFVTDGFTAGDRIVVEGAQILLSEEMKSQIQMGVEGQGK